MSDRYLIRIQAWPYSMEVGPDAAQAMAGPREQALMVPAQDIRGALAMAELFRDGMLTNPFVWQARIIEVREAQHGEDARFEKPCVTSVPKLRLTSPDGEPSRTAAYFPDDLSGADRLSWIAGYYGPQLPPGVALELTDLAYKWSEAPRG